ncbi:MAG: methylenetetrahydrofolate reductase [NAD(P)H] [Candidatus Hodarchaeales archaeon]|jgi:methylenetetrahydrofolate reductase (NADPH)
MKPNQMHKIPDIFERKGKTLSFEFFPPKKESQLDHFFHVVGELVKLEPDFISVTYGAGGSTRDQTMEISTKLQDQFDIPIVHHLTCIGQSRQQMIEILDLMKEKGIVNVLALRGDPPRKVQGWKKHPDGFSYAYELCELITTTYEGQFSCGVAGFPESHPDTPNKDLDAKYLKNKIEHGADYVITQLFYDNSYYFDYMARLRKIGVKARVIPGILPILNYKNIKNFCNFCGSSIPKRIHKEFIPIDGNQEAMQSKGVKLAIEQCTELLNHDNAVGIHLYTLNKLEPIREIVNNIKDFF